jgi:hypothetical protein
VYVLRRTLRLRDSALRPGGVMRAMARAMK